MIWIFIFHIMHSFSLRITSISLLLSYDHIACALLYWRWFHLSILRYRDFWIGHQEGVSQTISLYNLVHVVQKSMTKVLNHIVGILSLRESFFLLRLVWLSHFSERLIFLIMITVCSSGYRMKLDFIAIFTVIICFWPILDLSYTVIWRDSLCSTRYRMEYVPLCRVIAISDIDCSHI